MKGMEIFNSDDLSEDFFEFDDTEVAEELKNQEPPAGNEGNPSQKADKTKQTQADENDDETDAEDNELNELEVLLPSGKSANADKNTDSNSSSLSPKFFSSLVQALKEGGILEDVEDKDIKSQEDFFSVLDESIKAREFADLTEDQKTYLEALRAGIPHEQITAHQQNIDAYNSITEEAIAEETTDGEDLRRTIIMNNFTAKGIAEAKARKLADKIFDAGEDVEEAREALTELKEIEKKQFESQKQAKIKQKESQEKSEKEAVDKLNKVVKETKELIPGMQIPQTLKNDIIKGLTQPVAFTEDNRPLDIISKFLYDNPIDGRFKLAYILKVTDGMKKMNVLESKKARSNAFKDLQNALSVQDNGGSLDFDGDGMANEGFNFNDYKFI
jgi:hypothetical protein